MNDYVKWAMIGLVIFFTVILGIMYSNNVDTKNEVENIHTSIKQFHNIEVKEVQSQNDFDYPLSLEQIRLLEKQCFDNKTLEDFSFYEPSILRNNTNFKVQCYNEEIMFFYEEDKNAFRALSPTDVVPIVFRQID